MSGQGWGERGDLAGMGHVDVDGGVYWMLSHPRQAATLIGDWFSGSLTPANLSAAVPAGGADVTARDATVP